MYRVIPWGEWVKIAQPHYSQSTAEKGNDCGFYIDFCTLFHQKPGKEARSGGTFGHKRAMHGTLVIKAHIGGDKDNGLVHTIRGTNANVHDVIMMPELLTGEETVVYGDSGYLGAKKREDATVHNNQGKGINRRPSQSKYASVRSRVQIKRRKREKSSARAKAEHVFAVVKNQLYYRKTQYRGLRKQIAKLNIMFALANLILSARRCWAA